MRKRILSLSLVIFMFCAFAPCIHAAEIVDSGECGSKGDNLTWTLDSEGTLTISGEGEMEDYTNEWGNAICPSWYDYIENIKAVNISEGVTHIGNYAFYHERAYSKIISLSFPNTLKTIGERAFSHRCNIESITFPDGLIDIGYKAFDSCDIKYISFPDSLKTISEYAFFDNKPRSIDLGNGVETIGAYAFSTNYHGENGEKLESINIPPSVKTMDAAFAMCRYLKEINLDEENGNFKIVDDIVYSKDGKKLVFCPVGREKKGVVNVAEGTEVICRNAFECCKDITEIIIPEGVTTLNFGFASDCKNLRSLYIPSTITNLDNRAFFSDEWYNNEEISDMYFNGTEEQWKEITSKINSFGSIYGEKTEFHWNATGTAPPHIGDLTLGSSLSGGIADLIKVPLTNTEYDSEMITVFYKNGALVDMQTTPIQSGDEMKDIPIPENCGADNAKVFIWSSLDKMKPLCESKEIKLTEEDI